MSKQNNSVHKKTGKLFGQIDFEILQNDETERPTDPDYRWATKLTWPEDLEADDPYANKWTLDFKATGIKDINAIVPSDLITVDTEQEAIEWVLHNKSPKDKL